MKPETRTVNDLFERDVRYVVPLYQRPYVWKREEQWEPLWDDVRVLVEHQLRPGGNGTYWSHFLGAIVLEQQTTAPGAIPVYTVIDGQQRLTTLQILLAAAASVCGAQAERDGKLLARLTTNDELKAEGDELHKVWPTNANRPAFKAVMAPGGPPAERDDDPVNQIDESFAYFRSAIESWISEAKDEVDRIARVSTLRVTLTDLLKLVSITLEPDDNAQVIFETLNARGTQLLALDLVKNAIFHQADRDGLDRDRLYEEHWKPQLDSAYWRDERRQGRLYRPQGELFLMHWLSMKLAEVIPATELFETFRKRILQPRSDVAMLVHELCRDAATMRSFDEQPAGSVEATFFARLGTLDTTTVLPLVLLLFRDGRVVPERRRRALRALESWLVRRALMRLTTRAYNREMPVLLKEVAADIEHVDDVILAFLGRRASEAIRWPTDAELKRFLTERDVYGTLSQPRLEMALSAVESSLRSTKTEALPLPARLSVEHIIPRRWEASWPLSDDGARPEVDRVEAREARIHKLGNLTLVTAEMNASLSNGPWSSKRTELVKGSVLLLNAELLEAYPDRFDEAAIDARTDLLASRICGIWPGPDAPW